MSLIRSLMVSAPRSSIVPMSLVWNQPSSAVELRVQLGVEVAQHRVGTARVDLAGVARLDGPPFSLRRRRSTAGERPAVGQAAEIERVGLEAASYGRMLGRAIRAHEPHSSLVTALHRGRRDGPPPTIPPSARRGPVRWRASAARRHSCRGARCSRSGGRASTATDASHRSIATIGSGRINGNTSRLSTPVMWPTGDGTSDGPRVTSTSRNSRSARS